MAGTIQQPWNPVRLQEEHHTSSHSFCDLLCKEYCRDPLQRNSKIGSEKSLTQCNSSWVSEDLRRNGFAHDVCANPSSSRLTTTNCGKARAEKIISYECNDNGSAYVALLRACAKNKDLHRGARVHEDILRRGLLKKCSNALATMYAKCGALEKARELLVMHRSRDVFSWTSLISGYAQQGQGRDALDCFECMLHERLSPDAVTFSCVLKACGNLGDAQKGKRIHDEITRQGLLENDIVLGTALVDMYAKCGALEKAQQVLQQLPSRDVFAWSALITGYAKNGRAEQALLCFEQMQGEGVTADALTFSCILKACGSIGAAEMGAQIHDGVARQGLLRNNILLGTALVDMHAKCGALAKAQRVLDELSSRDVVSWNALIAGYAQLGQGERAMSCFTRMQREGLLPNAITFTCMLNACSNLGLVDDGHMYFEIMSTKYGTEPDSEHYACMVDLFGRAGRLDKAVGIIKEMPSLAYFSVWCALLGACQKWGDVNIGRWAFEHAVQADKSDAAAHVLLGNIYAAASMQEDQMSSHSWWIDE